MFSHENTALSISATSVHHACRFRTDPDRRGRSVVLLDVAVRLLEELLVAVELVLEECPASARCTSRSPAVVCCHPSKRMTRTISSMSSTTRSTTIGLTALAQLSSFGRSPSSPRRSIRPAIFSESLSFADLAWPLVLLPNCFAESMPRVPVTRAFSQLSPAASFQRFASADSRPESIPSSPRKSKISVATWFRDLTTAGDWSD